MAHTRTQSTPTTTTTTTTSYHYRSYRPPRSQTYPVPQRRPNAGAYEADGPWKHMTETFVWVAEQEFIKGHKRSMKTEDWVREQQGFVKREGTRHKSRRQDLEEVIYIYEVEAEEWMRQEERSRRVAAEREKARVRIQEEVRRIEARYEQKREAERRERSKSIEDAWSDYEARWSEIAASTDPLEFNTTPWPLILPPRDTTEITQEAIADFLFSPLHSATLTRKERIRRAQLRWHPDRFRRLLGRVSEKDRAAVEEGVGIVARSLNNLN